MEIMEEELTVGFAGNPNCGKTTLFNAFTGARLKVANWPGVTVEKKEGAMKYHNHRFKLVDTPGIYSLSSYTMEEKVTRRFLMDDEVDVIVNVVDASSLERNLFLTLQLIELEKPVILALNMMDIVEERGMEIDLHRLPEMLGIPVIPVSARKKTGLEILMHTVAHHKSKITDSNLEHHHYRMDEEKSGKHIHHHHEEYVMVYDDVIEDKIDLIMERFMEQGISVKNPRWHALKLLEQDEEITQMFGIDFSDIVDRSYEQDLINEKYDFIEEIMEEVMVNYESKAQSTEKIDRWLTHRYLGMPIFLGIMAVIFFLTFFVGDILKGGLEYVIALFTSGVVRVMTAIHTSETVMSLVTDGIIAGVGGILSFLPNIFILFLALAILEDSGYMSRVAYVMDDLMGHLGLSGRAFIPMLLGFGCSVPAIMASRALEQRMDRIRTVLVTPFMSCSARLPIYVLFSGMFFGKYAPLAAFSMYLIGMVTAIVTALLMNQFGKKNKVQPLLIELPEYKTPNAHTIFIYVWEKLKDYLTKAGTTIFLASVIIWFLMNFGVHGMVDDMSESFGAVLGHWLVPVLVPCGLGMWQIGVSLISGLAAKEVVVSSFSVLFGISNVNSEGGMDVLIQHLEQMGFTAVNAYALMLFCLLYTPCMATIATIRKELESRKWTMLAVVFQLTVAWAVTTLFYQTATLLTR